MKHESKPKLQAAQGKLMWEPPEYPGPCFDLHFDRFDGFIFNAEKLFENVCVTGASPVELASFCNQARMQVFMHSCRVWTPKASDVSLHVLTAGASRQPDLVPIPDFIQDHEPAACFSNQLRRRQADMQVVEHGPDRIRISASCCRKRPNNGPELNKTLGKALLFTTLGQSLRFTHATRKSGLEPKQSTTLYSC